MMKDVADVWIILPHGLVGLVIGWAGVLQGRSTARPLQGSAISAACIISCLYITSIFVAPWWAALSGLGLGAVTHLFFLLVVYSHTHDI